MPNIKKISEMSGVERTPVAIRAEFTYMLKEIAVLRPDLYNASEIAHTAIRDLWQKLKAEAQQPLIVSKTNGLSETITRNPTKACTEFGTRYPLIVSLKSFGQALLSPYINNGMSAQAGLVPTRAKVTVCDVPQFKLADFTGGHGGPIPMGVQHD